ncbi:MAG: hypothetical protein M1813_004750 [Trichoglossum hirsutum]|nr:MAG: hypothetical protein M1813_004750 [Trichoglossum hirsutum]
MAASKMPVGFKGEDVAKAPLDLDLSDAGRSSIECKKPKPPHRDPQATSQPPTIDEAKHKVTLLTLPVEIRIQMYDLLLVSWFDRWQDPWWAVRKTHQKMILLHMDRDPQYRTMEPGILQTCKQIYHEANLL